MSMNMELRGSPRDRLACRIPAIPVESSTTPYLGGSIVRLEAQNLEIKIWCQSSPQTSASNADVPMYIPTMASEPHDGDSDMEFIFDITDRAFCNSEPMLYPTMHCHADIPEALAKWFLSVGIIPAYSPICPIRTVPAMTSRNCGVQVLPLSPTCATLALTALH